MSAIDDVKKAVVDGFQRTNGQLARHDADIRLLQVQSAIDKREDEIAAAQLQARAGRILVTRPGTPHDDGVSFKASRGTVAALFGAGGLGAAAVWLMDFLRGKH